MNDTLAIEWLQGQVRIAELELKAAQQAVKEAQDAADLAGHVAHMARNTLAWAKALSEGSILIGQISGPFIPGD